MRKIVIAVLVAGATVLSTQVAQAEEIPTADLSRVEGLSAEQREAIRSFDEGSTITVQGSRKSLLNASVMASGSRRASYYRGSALMWTRDNVDFGYNWSSVTWTSPYQQAGWIWPNIARNGGISKYYDTTRNDRFRALNTIGAGIPTPWGDVKVYSSDYVHRLSVWHDGAWSAWSD